MCKCVRNIKIIVQTWIPNRPLVFYPWLRYHWSLTWNSSLRKSSIEYALDYRVRNWLSSTLHTTHTTAIVDFQFCFLFFQFSHWHPGVGFTFFFLLLGLGGMRDKLTIVKRFGTKAINFILQRTRVLSELFFQLHFHKL